jgi:hypothetical protein
MTSHNMTRNFSSFVVLFVVCFVVAVVYILYRVNHLEFIDVMLDPNAENVNSEERETRATLPMTPYAIFRHTALGQQYGQLGVISLATQEAARMLLPLRCERVHFAAGRGVCLIADRGVLTTYKAIIFDSALQRLYELSLNGAPSRTRVAPDGQVAAITVFVAGHSYATAGFSTQVTMVDLQNGNKLVENLEKFTVWRKEERLQAADLNFWGVTFTNDSKQFYVTLGTGGQTYLAKGNLQTSIVQVLREGIECPSLSPDNTRIAFKKRKTSSLGPPTWILSVLDLRTFSEWSLTETQSVDDQVEWLDNSHVLYYLPDPTSAAMTNIWVVQADGQGTPQLFMPQAYSPAVVYGETPTNLINGAVPRRE